MSLSSLRTASIALYAATALGGCIALSDFDQFAVADGAVADGGRQDGGRDAAARDATTEDAGSGTDDGGGFDGGPTVVTVTETTTLTFSGAASPGVAGLGVGSAGAACVAVYPARQVTAVGGATRANADDPVAMVGLDSALGVRWLHDLETRPTSWYLPPGAVAAHGDRCVFVTVNGACSSGGLNDTNLFARALSSGAETRGCITLYDGDSFDRGLPNGVAASADLDVVAMDDSSFGMELRAHTPTGVAAAWTRQVATPTGCSGCRFSDVAIDGSDVVAVGSFGGEVTLGAGTASIGGAGLYRVDRFNDDPQATALSLAATTRAVAVDANGGPFYVVGAAREDVRGAPGGGPGAFLIEVPRADWTPSRGVRFDNTGDTSNAEGFSSVAVRADGVIFVAGTVSDARPLDVDGDLMSGVIVVSLTPDFAVRWSRRWDARGFSPAFVDVAADGCVLVAGPFTGDVLVRKLCEA